MHTISGRKKMPVTWSPDINSKKHSPFQPDSITPQKSLIGLLNCPRNGVVLRSSPKKRVLLYELEKLANSDSADSMSPSKSRTYSPSKSSPTPKRLKVESKPIPNDNKNPLDVVLKGMSHDQLVNIIKQTVDKHPEIEKEIRDELPMPDLNGFEKNLKSLKHNIFRSLPTSRLVSKTDSLSYNRAFTHVMAFKKHLIEQGRTLVDSQHWYSIIEYATFAWTYVKVTPNWDNHAHNAMRRQCFKYLAGLFMNALKKGQFEKAKLLEIYEKIEGMISDSDDIQSCMKWIDVQIKSM